MKKILLVTEAEGFYPQEGRYILLEGEIVLDGEPITFTTGKLGQTGETVEQDGSLSDFIAVDIREQLAGQGYQNVQPIEGPIEFTLTVGGHRQPMRSNSNFYLAVSGLAKHQFSRNLIPVFILW